MTLEGYDPLIGWVSSIWVTQSGLKTIKKVSTKIEHVRMGEQLWKEFRGKYDQISVYKILQKLIFLKE